MTANTKDDVREFLLEFLAGKLKERGSQLPESVPDDCNLLIAGYLDSLGFVELMTATQERFGREIDFDKLDPDRMTVFGALSDFISQQLVNQD
jgi:acyl carrier protein